MRIVKRIICLFKGHYTGVESKLGDGSLYGFGGFMKTSFGSKDIEYYCLRCGEILTERKILNKLKKGGN